MCQFYVCLGGKEVALEEEKSLAGLNPPVLPLHQKHLFYLKPVSRRCHTIVFFHSKVRCDKGMIFPVPPLLKLSRAAGCDKPPDTVPCYHTVQQSLWVSFVPWTHITLVLSASARSVGPKSEFRRIQLPTGTTGCGVSLYYWFNPLRPL